MNARIVQEATESDDGGSILAYDSKTFAQPCNAAQNATNGGNKESFWQGGAKAQVQLIGRHHRHG